MSPKLARSEKARVRLLDFWQHRAEYGDPVGCVATTFTFDAGFFEEHCLGRFVGMQSDPLEDARSYLVEREEKLSQVFACVLVDQSQVAPQRSLRWHLLPVRVDGAILHAKVSILAWKGRVRVLLGSSNLTEPGYRKNFETLIALDFTPDGEAPLELLRGCLEFVERVRRSAPSPDASVGPQPALDAFLGRVRRLASGWPDESWRRGEPRATLLPVLPGGPTLFDQLRELWPGSPPSDALVVSPFYDEGDSALVALESVMAQRGGRRVGFAAPGRVLPDKRIEVELPGALRDDRRGTSCSFWYVPDREKREGGEEVRPLHAKFLALEKDGQALLSFGSSNFTGAGTGSGRVRNVELNLGIFLPDANDPFAKDCYEAIPPLVQIEPDAEVSFRIEHDRTPEAAGSVPLPSAFGALTFYPGDGNGALVFEFLGEPPEGFVAKSAHDDLVLNHRDWKLAGSPQRMEKAWIELRPPSHLRVGWTAASGESFSAVWVVNVSSTADLPPPDELRTLDLEELLEVLTSAQPLFRAVARISKRKGRGKGVDGQVVTDPHRKVDTRNFLLQRMRRLSRALEGMRERLERPVFSLEALRWRLHGPVGPVELARRLAQDEGEGAAFLIAEVAITVRAAQIKPNGDLRPAEVEREVRSVLEKLQALAQDEGKLPPNLRSYVKASFREAMS